MLTDMLSLLTMALSRFQSNFGDPETLFPPEGQRRTHLLWLPDPAGVEYPAPSGYFPTEGGILVLRSAIPSISWC
jgi:hypothetical protein